MYRALYRKWRPQRFEDVVAQRGIVTALRNQIASGRVGHAYLFTGVRGTGKTTCAKIFAKAVNCPHQEGGDPCCQCDICRGIENGSILRVEELGALMHEKKDTHYHFVLRPAFQAIGALREAVGDEAIVSQSNDSFELKIEEEQVPRLVAKMVQSGVDVMTVQPIQRTLEDSFIEITKGGNGIE